MTCSAKVILASQAPDGTRITTMQLRYWRAIHAEAKTHRVISNSSQAVEILQDVSFMDERGLSRNASSSRAIPVKKMLSQVWNEPAGPIHWGSNQPGMQARDQLKGWRLGMAKGLWKWTGRAAVVAAWIGMKLGGHKQWVNRILEPWQYISVVVTATDWDNFWALRDHEDAQPEIRELAQVMRLAYDAAEVQPVKYGGWHLPYVGDEFRDGWTLSAQLERSVACCARVSYLNHDGTKPDVAKDAALHDQLKNAEPPHMSPFEHQAMAMYGDRYANLRRFKSYRHFLEEGKMPE